MKITQKVWDSIFENLGDTPPEIGGILGSRDGEIVDIVMIDPGVSGAKKCSYTPDVMLLNRMIGKWQEANIKFMGIFHSHYFGVCSLSQGDISYIDEIMNAMPDSIQSLFFPIAVMPDKEFVINIARKNGNGEIRIEQDTIEVK